MNFFTLFVAELLQNLRGNGENKECRNRYCGTASIMIDAVLLPRYRALLGNAMVDAER